MITYHLEGGNYMLLEIVVLNNLLVLILAYAI